MYLSKIWKTGSNNVYGHGDNKTKLSVRVKVQFSYMYFQAVSKFQIIF